MTERTARGGAKAGADDVAAAERALERLFRLTNNRKLHARQAAAVGAVVTRAGYAVLRSVYDAGELSLGEIARECAMDPAAAGRQVKNLEDEGLIERTVSDEDARVVFVRLTERGIEVYDRIVAVRLQHTGDVLAGWSSHDRAELVRLVDRLVDDLRTVPVRVPDALQIAARRTTQTRTTQTTGELR